MQCGEFVWGSLGACQIAQHATTFNGLLVSVLLPSVLFQAAQPILLHCYWCTWKRNEYGEVRMHAIVET